MFFEHVESVLVPGAGTFRRRLYLPKPKPKPKPKGKGKAAVDEPPDPCATSVPQPGIGVPPGSIAFVQNDGTIGYLGPGSPGDRLRIASDGMPIWSPV
jgi:hypothetical protein